MVMAVLMDVDHGIKILDKIGNFTALLVELPPATPSLLQIAENAVVFIGEFLIFQNV